MVPLAGHTVGLCIFYRWVTDTHLPHTFATLLRWSCPLLHLPTGACLPIALHLPAPHTCIPTNTLVGSPGEHGAQVTSPSQCVSHALHSAVPSGLGGV